MISDHGQTSDDYEPVYDLGTDSGEEVAVGSSLTLNADVNHSDWMRVFGRRDVADQDPVMMFSNIFDVVGAKLAKAGVRAETEMGIEEAVRQLFLGVNEAKTERLADRVESETEGEAEAEDETATVDDTETEEETETEDDTAAEEETEAEEDTEAEDETEVEDDTDDDSKIDGTETGDQYCAAPVPRSMVPAKPGSVDGEAGSRIDFDLGPDGKIHPRSITHGDGTVTEYKWSKEGKVTEAVTKSRDGRALFSISADGDKFTVKFGAQTYKNVKGELTVADDGTFELTGKDHVWRTESKGTVSGEFKQSGGKFRIEINDEAVRLSEESKGKFLLHQATLKDGTTLIYARDKSGELSHVFEQKGTNFIEYLKDGDHWIRKLNGNARKGTVKLRDGIVPEFRESSEGVKVSEGDKVPDSRRTEKSGRVETLCRNLDILLESVFTNKASEAIGECTRKIMAEEGARLKTLGRDPVAEDYKKMHDRVNEARRLILVELDQELNQIKKSLAEERTALRNAKDVDEVWKNCPATQKAYKACLNWLQTRAVPGTLNMVKGMALDFVPGSPLTVPKEEGVFLIPERFRADAAKGELKLDLQIDTAKPPDQESLERLGKALRWVSDSQKLAEKQRQSYELNSVLPEVFSKNKLPEKWLEEAQKDPSKLPALRRMVDLSLTVRNYASAIKLLKLDAAGIAVMPPFANPVCGKDGKLTSLNLELPATLDMQSPDTLRKVEEWTKWLAKNGKTIDKAIEEESRRLEPSRQIFYGEVDMKGILYTAPDGKQEIIDPKDPKNAAKMASGKTQEFNLLEYNCKVTNKNGKIVLERTVQAKLAGICNYMNIGASCVGTPFTDSKPTEYNPSDPVAVRTSSGEVKVVRAAELEGHLHWQFLKQSGHKIVTPIMDVGMLVSSGGILLTAAKAGQLTLRVGIPAAIRAALGGSGFLLNNAAVKGNEFLHGVETARGLLMLLDVGQGTLRSVYGGTTGALRWLSGAGKAAETLSVAQKIELGLEAANAGSGWLWMLRASEYAHVPMELSNIPFGLMLTDDLRAQFRRASGQGDDPFAGRLAAKMTRDGHQIDQLPKTPKEIREYLKRARVDQLLDSYAQSLLRGGDKTENEKIKVILEQSKKLLDPAVSSKEREKFKGELMEYLYGSSKEIGEQIKDRQKRNNKFLPDDEIRSMSLDGLKEGGRLKVAAAVALLFLSGDGKRPLQPGTVLAKRDVDVPSHEITRVRNVAASRGTATTVESFSAATKVAQTFTVEDLLESLKRGATKKDDPACRMVTADLLVRAGARTPLSYASVLKDSLASANPEDRAAAIVQLGPMLNSIMLMETAMESKDLTERSRLQATLSGTTSEELKTALRMVAEGDKDKDVRALAGSVLHSLNKEYGTDELNTRIQSHSREYHARKASPGGFAQFFLDQMKKERHALDPASQLNAVLTLRSLGDMGGLADNKAFNAALVETMSERRPDVAFLAVKELKISNPEKDLGVKERQSILRFLSAETTKENSDLKIEIASSISQLVSGPTEKMAAEKMLASIIDSRGEKFARNFPEVRIAAITALSKINSLDSRPLLIQSTNPELEKDGRVRAAAVAALKTMNVSQLYEFAVDALKTESDPAVRATLLSIRQEKRRPVRDDLYKEEKQKFEAWLAEALENNPRSGKIVLDAKTDATNGGPYTRFKIEDHKSAVDTAGNNAKAWWSYMFISRQQDADNIEKARAGEEAVREAQWERLVTLAGQDAGKEERLILLYLAVGDSSPFGSDGDKYKRKAASAICKLCEPGSAFRKEFLKGVSQGLLNVNADEETRLTLLETLHSFTKKSKDDARGSDEMKLLVSSIVAEAFGKQLQNQPDSDMPNYQASMKLQRRMLGLLSEYKERRSYPSLEAAIRRHPNRISDLARQTLADLRDRVLPEWDSTKTNTLSMEARKTALESSIKSASADELVAQLFASYKGKPLDHVKDARIPLYLDALTDGAINAAKSESLRRTEPRREGEKVDGTERVQLAAALVILQKDNTGISREDKDRAIATVAKIAMLGSEVGYRQDARTIIDGLLKAGAMEVKLSSTESYKLLRGEYGVSIVRQQNGKVTEVSYPDERVAKFEYDGSLLTKYSAPGGFTYTRVKENGKYSANKWLGSDGKISETTDDRVTPEGTYVWADSRGIETSRNIDGTVTFKHPNKKEVTLRNDKLVHVKTPPDSSGRQTERHFTWNDDGELVKVKEGNGKVYKRLPVTSAESKPGSKKDAVYTWVDESDPKKSYRGAYNADKNGDYSWRSEKSPLESRFTGDGTRVLKYDDGRELHSDIEGRPTLLKYRLDSDDFTSRTFTYDGAELVKMTYERRSAWKPNESTRLKGKDGKYTNDWNVTWHNPQLDRQMTETYSGKMSVTSDGDYSWVGFNNFTQSHKFDGKQFETGSGR